MRKTKHWELNVPDVYVYVNVCVFTFMFELNNQNAASKLGVVVRFFGMFVHVYFLHLLWINYELINELIIGLSLVKLIHSLIIGLIWQDSY